MQIKHWNLHALCVHCITRVKLCTVRCCHLWSGRLGTRRRRSNMATMKAHVLFSLNVYKWFYMELRSEFDQNMATITYLKAQGSCLSIKINYFAQVCVFIKLNCLLSDSFGWVPYMFLLTICFSSDGGGRGVTIPPNYLIEAHVTPPNPCIWTVLDTPTLPPELNFFFPILPPE